MVEALAAPPGIILDRIRPYPAHSGKQPVADLQLARFEYHVMIGSPLGVRRETNKKIRNGRR
jgi:hypothetical protein